MNQTFFSSSNSFKKSRIRETLKLSTDEDSINIAIKREKKLYGSIIFFGGQKQEKKLRGPNKIWWKGPTLKKITELAHWADSF